MFQLDSKCPGDPGIPIESSQVQPSVISFSAAISACEKLGQAAEAGRQLGGLVTKDGESVISITGFSQELLYFV